LRPLVVDRPALIDARLALVDARLALVDARLALVDRVDVRRALVDVRSLGLLRDGVPLDVRHLIGALFDLLFRLEVLLAGLRNALLGVRSCLLRDDHIIVRGEQSNDDECSHGHAERSSVEVRQPDDESEQQQDDRGNSEEATELLEGVWPVDVRMMPHHRCTVRRDRQYR
jgi:hypothetical protein